MSVAVVPGAVPAGPRTRTTETHCPYCVLQCGVAVTAGDRPASLVPLDLPTNRGGLCSKGWSAPELLDHRERPTRPLVRAVPGDRTSPLVESSRDEALDRVVAAIGRTRAEHGRDAVGCFGGGLTDEQAHRFGEFARVALRTSAIDHDGRLCMSTAAGAATRAFGLDRGLPLPARRRRRGRRRPPADGDRTRHRPAPAAAPGTDLAPADGLRVAVAEGLVDEVDGLLFVDV